MSNFCIFVLVKLLRQYFSIFMILLVCVPVMDRAYDEWSHLSEVHCDDVSTHYCKAEHHCPVCDYVFAAASLVPEVISSPCAKGSTAYLFPVSLIEKTNSHSYWHPLLRGPPVC